MALPAGLYVQTGLSIHVSGVFGPGEVLCAFHKINLC